MSHNSRDWKMIAFANTILKKAVILEALRLQVLCTDPTEMELDTRDDILVEMRRLIKRISRRGPLPPR
jgi:hypothetical protein